MKWAAIVAGLLLGLASLLRPLVAAAEPSSASPALLLLLAKRIAASPTQAVVVSPRGLPPGFRRTFPLPHGTLLGSVARTPRPAADPMFFNAPATYSIYYTLATPREAYRYLARLEHAGWKISSRFPNSAAGFQSSLFSGPSTLLCKAGAPPLTLEYTQRDPTALSITTDKKIPVFSGCSASPFVGFNHFPHTPVPDLTAPSGVVMTERNAGVQGGRSGATLITTSALASVLDAFASQMSKAGWKSESQALANDVGTAAFSYVDDKRRTWQAVLTIYRSRTASDTYYAFIDATQTDTK